MTALMRFIGDENKQKELRQITFQNFYIVLSGTQETLHSGHVLCFCCGSNRCRVPACFKVCDV